MIADGVKFDTNLGRPGDVVGYSDEVIAAMKLLEPLIQKGLLAVHPDRWQAGQLGFLRPRIAMRQGWAVHTPDIHVTRWALMPMEDVRAVEQFAEVVSVADSLTSAIEATARLLHDEVEHMVALGMKLGPEHQTTPLHRRLAEHFDELLRRQLDALRT